MYSGAEEVTITMIQLVGGHWLTVDSTHVEETKEEFVLENHFGWRALRVACWWWVWVIVVVRRGLAVVLAMVEVAWWAMWGRRVLEIEILVVIHVDQLALGLCLTFCQWLEPGTWNVCESYFYGCHI